MDWILVRPEIEHSGYGLMGFIAWLFKDPTRRGSQWKVTQSEVEGLDEDVGP